MTVYDLKEKRKRAREVFLKYKDTNQTNKIEEEFLPLALETIRKQLPDFAVYSVPDSFLNYLGVDIIAINDKSIVTYDLKVCQHEEGMNVLIDAYSHNGDVWYSTYQDKANDAFIFINKDNIIIVPASEIIRKLPSKEDCFFMKRDLKKTKLKAVIDVSDCRKLIIERSKV